MVMDLRLRSVSICLVVGLVCACMVVLCVLCCRWFDFAGVVLLCLLNSVARGLYIVYVCVFIFVGLLFDCLFVYCMLVAVLVGDC